MPATSAKLPAAYDGVPAAAAARLGHTPLPAALKSTARRSTSKPLLANCVDDDDVDDAVVVAVDDIVGDAVADALAVVVAESEFVGLADGVLDGVPMRDPDGVSLLDGVWDGELLLDGVVDGVTEPDGVADGDGGLDLRAMVVCVGREEG